MNTLISVTVNGTPVQSEVVAETLLSTFLREQLSLTGTHIGCDTSQCGACVIHLNGQSVKSCTMLAVQADGASITTIEGVAEGDTLHAIQTAFRDCHGLQCGFCTPGMIMSAVDLLQQNSNPSVDEIKHWLEGNICRCTGYHNIILAIQQAAKELHSK